MPTISVSSFFLFYFLFSIDKEERFRAIFSPYLLPLDPELKGNVSEGYFCIFSSYLFSFFQNKEKKKKKRSQSTGWFKQDAWLWSMDPIAFTSPKKTLEEEWRLVVGALQQQHNEVKKKQFIRVGKSFILSSVDTRKRNYWIEREDRCGRVCVKALSMMSNNTRVDTALQTNSYIHIKAVAFFFIS